MNNIPKRKHIRIEDYDYSTPGAYFITVCTANREKIFWSDRRGELCSPSNAPLSDIGMIVDHEIQKLNSVYDSLRVDKYCIMPDHIHLLISIHNGEDTPEKRTSRIARFIGTFKRFCNKEYGENIWQGRFHDHVIRNQQDYDETWEYIANNPRKWAITRHILE